MAYSVQTGTNSDVSTVSISVGLVVPVAITIMSYLFFFGVSRGSYRYDQYFIIQCRNINLIAKLCVFCRYEWDLLQNSSAFFARQFNSLKLILRVLFCHPPGPECPNSSNTVQPLRLLFTDQTKVKIYVMKDSLFVIGKYLNTAGGNLCRRRKFRNPDDRIPFGRG